MDAPQPRPDANMARELREVARSVEESTADALAELADIAFSLAVGDARRFPREASEDRAAVRGIEVLKEWSSQAIAALYALAEAAERGIDVPPAWRQPVQPYIDTYLRAQGDAPSEQRTEQG